MESTLINKDEREVHRIKNPEDGKDVKYVSAPAYISSVPPWSLAAEIGLETGDKIIAVDGIKLRDIMDFQFHFSQAEEIELLVERDGKELFFDVKKQADDELGVEFKTPLFNGVQECANKCPFCFIENQPYEETRESLHLRDDDFRLSYLHGSYVTLTNLSYSDRKRIEELRPGPLYVSVHATEPEVRNLMLGRKKSAPILEELSWLSGLGIPVHTQIVLCPGMNDGKHLLQTIEDLYSMKDSPVVSVAVVPVGLTKFHRAGLRRFETDELLETINIVEGWEGEDSRRKNFVFMSDEFYLMTHSPVPRQDYYGEYPQLEDGVGMTRLFLNELEEALDKYETKELSTKRISWINGTLARPIVEAAAKKINEKFPGLDLRPICLDSLFWGTTNVSGLLTGNDIVQALKYVPKEFLGERVIIPSVMLKDGEDIFLDDMSLEDLEKEIGLQCTKAWGAEQLLAVIASHDRF